MDFLPLTGLMRNWSFIILSKWPLALTRASEHRIFRILQRMIQHSYSDFLLSQERDWTRIIISMLWIWNQSSIGIRSRDEIIISVAPWVQDPVYLTFALPLDHFKICSWYSKILRMGWSPINSRNEFKLTECGLASRIRPSFLLSLFSNRKLPEASLSFFIS